MFKFYLQKSPVKITILGLRFILFMKVKQEIAR